MQQRSVDSGRLGRHPAPEERTSATESNLLYSTHGIYPSPGRSAAVPASVGSSWDWEFHGVLPTALARRLVQLDAWLSGFTGYLNVLTPSRANEFLDRQSFRVKGTGPHDSATLVLRDWPHDRDVFRRASGLVMGALTLRSSLRQGTLRCTDRTGSEVEMGQFFNLFGTSLDILGSRHLRRAREGEIRITVMCRGFAFVVCVGDPQVFSRAAFERVLRLIAKTAAAQASCGAMGLFSCAGPGLQQQIVEWCKASSPACIDTLNQLADSLFTLCLDTDLSPDSIEHVALAAHCNSANRWYVSSLQLVAFEGGKGAMLASFNSMLDGNTMMRAAQEVARPPTSSPEATGDYTCSGPLPFGLPSGALRQCQQAVADQFSDGTSIFLLEGIGRTHIRDAGWPASFAFVAAVHATLMLLGFRRLEVKQYVSQECYRHLGVRRVFTSHPEMLAFAAMLAGRPHAGSKVGRTALEEYERRMTQARRHLPLLTCRQMFDKTRTQWQAKRVAWSYKLVNWALKATGSVWIPDIRMVISQPRTYPDVLLVGRPGIRSPGDVVSLHCIVEADNIRLVLSDRPGFDRQSFVHVLRCSLERLCQRVPADESCGGGS